MEYNSFYGGRRGASFVIVKRFSTINEMVSAFQQGGAYKTVNYDEYILIDTINKNNKDNGKIFRRGYDYNNSMGGAIYEGQIVGPSGPAPHTLMTTIDEVDKITKQDGLVDEEGNSYRRTEGKYAPTTNLVPGAKGTIENRIFDDTTDSIQWAAVSVRDANSYESTVYIGFKFPYTVIDFTAQSVSPYYNRDNDTASFVNQDLVERVDNAQHPFYEKWNISIPKGIKGDALKNFRVMTANTSIQNYEGRDDDIANNREVLVYDYYNYDAQENGAPITIYLGDYNMITDIDVTEDGIVNITYSHNDVYTQHLRWVNNIIIDDNGQVTLKYTVGEDVVLNKKLNFILETAIDSRYHLLVLYTDPDSISGTKVSYNDRDNWVDLGYIGYGDVGAVAGSETDEGVSAVANILPPYSAWLIIEDNAE